MALIPPFFMDCVVAIGVQTTQNGTVQKNWIGTGFLYGNHTSTDPNNPENRNYKVYLVTNKHVLNNQTEIILRFNPQNGQPATDFTAPIKMQNGDNLWTGHPSADVDVAVLAINIQLIQNAGMKFGIFKSDSDILTKQQLADSQVSEGDFIYVLGFPMGMMPSDRQHVIVRSGVIARIRDLFENRSNGYTIDSLVFPGNSGGPIIFKPEIVSIQGTPALNRAALIGIVKSYIPFQDVAISQQTQRPRVVFEENSGLANVETVDKIIDTIQADIARQPSA